MKKTVNLLGMVLMCAVLLLTAGCGPKSSVEYVDLGLPSGLLWATCNLGADRSEGCGDFYAWGETHTKDIYDWSTYRYATVKEDGRLASLTKYVLRGEFYGFEDHKTTLEATDDVATQQLGKGARIPTVDDWTELRHYTTGEWTKQNGVAGWRFTGENGNSIFLPATGHRFGKELSDRGKCGLYWSSTVRGSFQDGAWALGFSSTGRCLTPSVRAEGFAVRAVHEAKK